MSCMFHFFIFLNVQQKNLAPAIFFKLKITHSFLPTIEFGLKHCRWNFNEIFTDDKAHHYLWYLVHSKYLNPCEAICRNSLHKTKNDHFSTYFPLCSVSLEQNKIPKKSHSPASYEYTFVINEMAIEACLWSRTRRPEQRFYWATVGPISRFDFTIRFYYVRDNS